MTQKQLQQVWQKIEKVRDKVGQIEGLVKRVNQVVLGEPKIELTASQKQKIVTKYNALKQALESLIGELP